MLRASNRLTAIVSLGIQGFAVALLFLLLGAPDLSFTQFMIETLSVVILALVMTRLQALADRSPAAARRRCRRHHRARLRARLRAAAAEGDAGAVRRPRSAISSAHYSKAIAHGRNIVNVIIVDFRGLDTLGEIAVVMIAGLAILALIRMTSRRAGRQMRAEEA